MDGIEDVFGKGIMAPLSSRLKRSLRCGVCGIFSLIAGAGSGED